MVLPQRSSQVGTSAKKKQQSISNFFTKNAVSSKPPATLLPSSSYASILSERSQSFKDEALFITSDDEKNIAVSGQRSITPKRGLEDEENDDSQDNANSHACVPPRKRLRTLNLDQVTEDVAASGNGEPINQKLSSVTSTELKTHKGGSHTSRYTFSRSLNPEDENALLDEDTQKRKRVLHEKFVKKLGRPDSIAEIKRRNWQNIEELPDLQIDQEDAKDIEEESTAKAPTKSKGVAAKKSRSKLTPMVKQFLAIKRDNMDTILVVEVGYKFKFFGEDARVAAKELSIVCIPGKFRYDEHVSEAHLDSFASASFPTHRLPVHVKRLVNAGHKVGIVRQLETAALKAAGDNRNAPFTRKLTNLYTKGTYVDDVEGIDPTEGSSSGVPATGYLFCITESNAKGWGTDEKVNVGMVAVQPSTGDVIYDDFEDGFMRSEIETRLLHVAPCEILIVGKLSKATDKLVQHLSGSKTNVFGDKVRLERVERPKTMVAEAYSHVSNFYAGKMKVSNPVDDAKASKLLENVLKMTKDVIVCLSAMITHMSDYGLEHVFDLTKYFQSFSARSHMILNGTSLTSLEIYQNQTDHSQKGSLFWTLDRTQTRFGQRLLRKWVGRPLLLKEELENRIAAVEELKNGERSVKVDKAKHVLSQIKIDLERSLIRIYYGKVLFCC